ncbi:MAG: hypothetical protein ABSH33_12205 [Steroidobacteraceae bacterium]
MKKILLSAAVLLLCGMTPAFAANYTFEDESGGKYCDGLTLDQSGGIATGTHTGCTEGDYAGGLEVKIKGDSDTLWSISTTDAENASGSVLVYVLDEKELTWALYSENTTDAVAFQLVNYGLLKKGIPKAGADVGRPTISVERK